jgi:hypothetical protein
MKLRHLLVALTFTCLSQSSFTSIAHAELTSNVGKTVMIPAGTTFEGRVDQTLGSAKSSPGTKFAVTMSSPALGNGQDVIVPAGSQFLGEVVEAIPSKHLPHKKGYDKPTGKLRVQLTGLRVAGGSTYQIVASFIKDAKASSDLGTGVAYVGTQAGFNGVYPRGGGPGSRNTGGLVSKDAMLKNALYGDPDRDKQHQSGDKNAIRSLVKKGNELIIANGSPMSIRLDAPLRLSLTPIAETANPFQQGNDFQPPSETTGGRRFSHDPATQQVIVPKETAAPAAPVATPLPVDNTPAFLTPIPGTQPIPAKPNFAPSAVPQAPAAPASASPGSI